MYLNSPEYAVSTVLATHKIVRRNYQQTNGKPVVYENSCKDNRDIIFQLGPIVSFNGFEVKAFMRNVIWEREEKNGIKKCKAFYLRKLLSLWKGNIYL